MEILIMLLIRKFLLRTYTGGKKSKSTVPYLKALMKKTVAVTTNLLRWAQLSNGAD